MNFTLPYTHLTTERKIDLDHPGWGWGAEVGQIKFSRIFHCLVLQPKLLFFKYFHIFLNWNMDGKQEAKMCLNSICFYMQKSIPATSTYGSGREIAKESQGIILLPNHTGFEVLKDKINKCIWEIYTWKYLKTWSQHKTQLVTGKLSLHAPVK